MEKKFKLLLLALGALTLFSACSSVYTDTEMKARGVVMFLSKTMGPTSFEKRWQTTNKAAIVENFKNGERDGELKRYYLNGNLLMRFYYEAGKVEGPWEDYYPNGKIKREETYKNDVRDGSMRVYYENGNLGMKAFFVNGKREGTIEFYEEDGKKIEKNK